MPAPTGCPFHDTALAISTLLKRSWQVPGPDGRVPRTFHDKTHACLNATFHVEPPAEARFRHGLFAARKSYPAIVRLSSGVFENDAKPDARGFALKLRDVEGELCEGAPAGQHDLILTSVTTLGMRDAADALALQEAVVRGETDPDGETARLALHLPRPEPADISLVLYYLLPAARVAQRRPP